MALGKILVAAALVVLFLPVAQACFVSSSLDLQIEEPPLISPDDTETLTANLTLSWGFGAFLPLPVTIYVEVMGAPDWLYVSPVSSFTLTPQGWTGGSESRTFSVKMSASEETSAFVYQDLTIRAYTNGSFLVRGSEDTQSFRVAQDFVHRDLAPQVSASALTLYTGESQRVYLNMTNRCNADLAVTVKALNFSSDWTVRLDRTEMVIPPSFTGNPEVSLPLVFKAEGESEENGWLEITYHPAKDSSWGPETVTVPIYAKSRDRGMAGGTIAAIIVLILLAVVIVALVWRKYQRT
ncbi:MAG: hypothetical protein ACP5EK_06940 [Thermoplasmatota archaeon]